MAVRRLTPTREELAAAAGKTVPDLLEPDLGVVFCGINPSLYSAATGHHFARPGNRFWRALHDSGLMQELVAPIDDATLLSQGIGITNFVERATATAAELTSDELRAGAVRLEQKMLQFAPRVLAVLGIGAFASGFGRPPSLGRQGELLAGTTVFVLPNPSGLQAHYQLPDLANRFREVRDFAFGVHR